MASKSNDLVAVGDTSPFALLRMDQSEVQDLLRENIGGDGLTERDLDRIRVPSGGGSRWEIPTIHGTDAITEIEGVIVHRATRRAYWPNKFDGSNDPPQCFSDDGVNGQGDPGVACIDCPHNEFGTSTKQDGTPGDGKACKEMRQLFVLTADSLIPIVVTIPPASLQGAKQYFLRLLRAQLSPLDTITKLGLEKAKSKGGIDFSRVTFTAGDRLDPEAKERIKQYAAQLMPAFQAAARVDRTDLGE